MTLYHRDESGRILSVDGEVFVPTPLEGLFREIDRLSRLFALVALTHAAPSSLLDEARAVARSNERKRP